MQRLALRLTILLVMFMTCSSKRRFCTEWS